MNQCTKCQQHFSQKSSLNRHIKRCPKDARIRSVRQKSCRECSVAKTRCDSQRPSCQRCMLRCTPCQYLSENQMGDANDSEVTRSGQVHPSATSSSDNSARPDGPSMIHDPELLQFDVNNLLDASLQGTSTPSSFLDLDSTDLDLYPIDARYDVLEPDIPPLAKHSMSLILRVFRTWPSALAKGLLVPPYIHHTQVTDDSILWPLANCQTISQMWHRQSPGSTLLQETVTRETQVLFAKYAMLDAKHSLAALQALVVYTIMLFFPNKRQVSVSLVEPGTLLAIQRTAIQVSKTGLFLEEERANSRPSWEAWTHIAAKRRTISSLYCLHWAYTVYHHVPTLTCRDLVLMPAPAPKYLWQAQTAKQWEALYNRWLAEWDGRPYMQGELGSVHPGVVLDERTERWLEDADEYGILQMALINATEIGAQFETVSC